MDAKLAAPQRSELEQVPATSRTAAPAVIVIWLFDAVMVGTCDPPPPTAADCTAARSAEVMAVMLLANAVCAAERVSAVTATDVTAAVSWFPCCCRLLLVVLIWLATKLLIPRTCDSTDCNREYMVDRSLGTVGTCHQPDGAALGAGVGVVGAELTGKLMNSSSRPQPEPNPSVLPPHEQYPVGPPVVLWLLTEKCMPVCHNNRWG